MPADNGIDLRRLGWTAAGLAATIALAIGAVFLLLRHWHAAPGGAPSDAAALAQVPAPRLQPAPQEDMAWMRAEQRREMDTVGWVDREAGIARIPVADAMDLVAAGKGRR